MRRALQQLSKADLESQVLQINSPFVIFTPARTRVVDGDLAC